MIVLLPVLICIIGVLLFALSKNPDIKELCRIMFFCGLLATLLRVDTLIKLIP